MNVKDLKNKILSNKIKSGLYIFKYTDDGSRFLCFQYLHELSKKLKFDITPVDDIDDSYSINFDNSCDIIKFKSCDTFSTNKLVVPDESLYVIICKDIDKDMKLTDYTMIEFPKLKDWQILDYIKSRCPGLTEGEINWLYDVTDGNIDRIHNELNKISIFKVEEQSKIFSDYASEDGLVDLNVNNIFKFITAIMKKDYKVISDVLRDIDFIDIEGTGVVTLLRRNIKQLMQIQMNPSITPSDMGIKQTQFNAIKWNCGKYSNEELINMLFFLNTIDDKLKSGKLDIINNRLVDYIICNIVRR